MTIYIACVGSEWERNASFIPCVDAKMRTIISHNDRLNRLIGNQF